MAPKKRALSEKQQIVRPADSVGSSIVSDESSDEGDDDGEEGEEQRDSRQASGLTSGRTGSSSAVRSSECTSGDSDDSDSDSDEDGDASDKASGTQGGGDAEDDDGDESWNEDEPLLSGRAGDAAGRAAAKSAAGKAKAKAQASGKRQTASLGASIPTQSFLVGGACCAAIVSIAAVFWFEWCILSGWSDWGGCQPEWPGAPACEGGVQFSSRLAVHGNCGGRRLLRNRSCWMGPCVLPDLLAVQPRLPCNAKSREWLLRSASSAYGDDSGGGRRWAALESCERSYLCCYPCDEVSDLAKALECGGERVAPQSIVTGGGCYACFATLGGAPLPDGSIGAGCNASEVACERRAVSDVAAASVDGPATSMCCLAVGPQPPPPGEPIPTQPPPAALDEENFHRRPNMSAFIGELHHSEVWPTEPDEGSCQTVCWHDPECYLYTFISRLSALTEGWPARCVTLTRDEAEEMGRASPLTWLEEPLSYSGFKRRGVAYPTVVITVRTSEAPGSGSNGRFRLLLCASMASCETRSAMLISDVSCKAEARCLQEGVTAHFVGDVPVSRNFKLRAMRIECISGDAWTIERLVMDVEGSIAQHHGEVTVDMSQPWMFAVGCVTDGELPCLSECFGARGNDDYYGWCYTDEAQEASGTCTSSCKKAAEVHGQGFGRAAAKVSSTSCAELNWPTMSHLNHDPKVCGASMDAPLPGCSGPSDWAGAKEFCEKAGARLCTQPELENDEAAGTGCELDGGHAWSSTPCEGGGFMIVPGSIGNGFTLHPHCFLPDVKTVWARCCADANRMDIIFRARHRDSHTLPAHMHDKSEGGLSNWQVVTGRNFADNWDYFLQSGMQGVQAPLESDSLDVWLSDIPISPRGGAIDFYFKIDSEPWQDQLHFFIDGVEQTTGGFPVSGHIAWTLARFSFPSRPDRELHEFRWEYRKDRSNTVGRDVACIDRIVVYGVLEEG